MRQTWDLWHEKLGGRIRRKKERKMRIVKNRKKIMMRTKRKLKRL